MIANVDDSASVAPFTVGDLELLFVPNSVEGARPTLLVIAQQGHERLYTKLTSTEARQLATNLRIAANEADSLVTGARGSLDMSKERRRKPLNQAIKSAVFHSS